MNELEQRAVAPFYLKLTGLNAVRRNGGAQASDDTQRAELVVAGRTVDLFDAKWLLNVGAWRPVVMGAWFSLQFDKAEIGTELRQAMRSSAGSLTAPPLATACVLLLGSESLPDLDHYASTDPGSDGSAQFVGAAMQFLGATPPIELFDDSQHARVLEMLRYARRLQCDLTKSD